MAIKRTLSFGLVAIIANTAYGQELLSIPIDIDLLQSELAEDLNANSAYAIIETPSAEDLELSGYLLPNSTISRLDTLSAAAAADRIRPAGTISGDALSRILTEAYKSYGIPPDIMPEQEPTIIINDSSPYQAPGGGHEPFPRGPRGGPIIGPTEPTPIGGNPDDSLIDMFNSSEANIFSVDQ